jgi:hypothetical protein
MIWVRWEDVLSTEFEELQFFMVGNMSELSTAHIPLQWSSASKE